MGDSIDHKIIVYRDEYNAATGTLYYDLLVLPKRICAAECCNEAEYERGGRWYCYPHLLALRQLFS